MQHGGEHFDSGDEQNDSARDRVNSKLHCFSFSFRFHFNPHNRARCPLLCNGNKF